MLSSLQNRECVVALEAIDRIARSGDAVDPTEFKRLQQTADQNCSQDPARRREQEDMAASFAWRRATSASTPGTNLPTCSSRAAVRRATS